MQINTYSVIYAEPKIKAFQNGALNGCALPHRALDDIWASIHDVDVLHDVEDLDSRILVFRQAVLRLYRLVKQWHASKWQLSARLQAAS